MTVTREIPGAPGHRLDVAVARTVGDRFLITIEGRRAAGKTHLRDAIRRLLPADGFKVTGHGTDEVAGSDWLQVTSPPDVSETRVMDAIERVQEGATA